MLNSNELFHRNIYRFTTEFPKNPEFQINSTTNVNLIDEKTIYIKNIA